MVDSEDNSGRFDFRTRSDSIGFRLCPFSNPHPSGALAMICPPRVTPAFLRRSLLLLGIIVLSVASASAAVELKKDSAAKTVAVTINEVVQFLMLFLV